MRWYHPTPATHLMSAAIAIAFGGSGLVAVLHANMGFLAFAIMLPVALGVTAVLTALGDNQMRAAILMAALSAVSTYAFIIIDILVMTRHRRFGWLMLAVSALVVAQALFAGALSISSREHRAPPARLHPTASR